MSGPESNPRFAEIIAKIQKLRDKPAQPESFQQVEKALSALGPDWGKTKNILVAGTNGKGTVAKTLETLLSAQGESIGLFTSPHLISTTERIRSHGRDLSEAEFVEAYELIREIADEYGLSHFGTLTLMMVEVFFMNRVRPRVDRAVIEVGVGGRLDPTRLIPHPISVVTKLGLDHVEFLGGTLPAIAREKFAIAEAGGLLVHAPMPQEVSLLDIEEEIRDVAKRVEAPIFSYRINRTSTSAQKPIWVIETPWGEAALQLPGRRAVENTSLALVVMDQLGYPVESLLGKLADVRWPGRMEELIYLRRRVFLSGDHNIQGIESLREIVAQFSYRKIHAVVAVGSNKPAQPMLDALSEIRDIEFYLTQTPFRAGPLDKFGMYLDKAAFVSEDPFTTLQRVIECAQEDDLILVTGSLYLVGEVRKIILNSSPGSALRSSPC